MNLKMSTLKLRMINRSSPDTTPILNNSIIGFQVHENFENLTQKQLTSSFEDFDKNERKRIIEKLKPEVSDKINALIELHI
jgi:Mg/Co/Ni transporter MgtE